ncbi:MAG: AsnC family transcriptional regulator [bacterium]
MTDLDTIDRGLLNLLQWDFPLEGRPFTSLGRRVGLSEAEVINRIERLKAAGIIRQISAIFDTQRLGYQSSLVAFRVDPRRIDQAAAIVNQHPGVSHNYQRDHAYNLWFTIAVPPDTDLGGTVHRLAELSQPEKMLLLPALKVYKIGVRLDMADRGQIAEREEIEKSAPVKEQEHPTFSDREIAAIRALQRDLPIIADPFGHLSQELNVPTEELVSLAKQFLERGQMRRYAAVLNHRKLGYGGNVMAVWVVPEERMDECGGIMASFKAVSHCYRRPTYPDWPYSLFTMIHDRSEEGCMTMARAISSQTGLKNYALLFSNREFKKTRVQYFSEEGEMSTLRTPCVQG